MIRNADQGIKIENGSPLIRNNIIEFCTINSGSEFAHGAGISCKGGATIQDNIIRSNTGNWNGDSMEHYTFGGGIYIENNSSDPVTVINNQILNCSSQE